METISILKKWLKKDGNTKAKLAYLMGYESSLVIDKWLSRQEIPAKAEQYFFTIIKQGASSVKNKKSKSGQACKNNGIRRGRGGQIYSRSKVG